MTSSNNLRTGLRAFLMAAALVVFAAPSVFAQHSGGGHGGGGSHGGGGGYHGGGSHGGQVNGQHGGGWHGGGYHGGGYYGGYYGRGYYPYWGWGWGGGWGWGLGWGWGYPGWGYGYAGWGYPGYGYGGYGYGVPGGTVTVLTGEWAIVATDVSPETTRVFLDGRFIGMVEDFNGPDFLYLKKGDYQLEFRLDGFESKSINVNARAGAQMKISEKLSKIPNASQYGSYDNPEPEGGVQRYWSKESNAPVHPVNAESAPPSQAQPWRGNAYSQPGQVDLGEAGSGNEVAMDPAPQVPLGAKQRARILFHITPGDAAVYLNDHFIGTGEELSTLTRGFQVAPGQHSLTVSRPGMVTREETVVVGPGKSETVEISLQSN
jgi:hypothetical protein